MSGKSPYQATSGKIPFFGNTESSNRKSIDPILVGSPKTSVYVNNR